MPRPSRGFCFCGANVRAFAEKLALLTWDLLPARCLRAIVFFRARGAGSLFAEVIYKQPDTARKRRRESGFTAYQMNLGSAGCGFPHLEK